MWNKPDGILDFPDDFPDGIAIWFSRWYFRACIPPGRMFVERDIPISISLDSVANWWPSPDPTIDDAEYLKSETSHNKLPGSIIVLSDDLT